MQTNRESKFEYPKDIEAEASILSAMMVSKKAIPEVMEKIKAENFYAAQHGLIYEAIESLWKQGKEVDLITVANQLQKAGHLAEVGGRTYLAQIADYAPNSFKLNAHIEIVKDQAIRRSLIEYCDSLKYEVQGTEVENVLELAQKGLLEISNNKIRTRVKNVGEILTNVLDELDSESKPLSISTGYPDVDKHLIGFKEGELIIVAARPSVGKTTLALNFAIHAAKEKVPVLIFSIETAAEQMMIRVLSSVSSVDSTKILKKVLTETEKTNVMKAAGRVGDMPIFLEDTGALNTLELRSIVRQLQMKEKLGLIIIDYLSLMASSNKKPEGRYQEVSQMVREIKAFAKESGIPIVLLSQLSRENEKRADKRPNLSDLRESGEIEQVADVVMLLHRDDYYEAEKQGNVSVMEVNIAKNRNGSTGLVKLTYRRDVSKFLSYISEADIANNLMDKSRF